MAIDILLPADHPNRNRHHEGGYRSEEEYYDTQFCRGAGDPDFHGYPGLDADNVTIDRHTHEIIARPLAQDSSDEIDLSDSPF